MYDTSKFNVAEFQEHSSNGPSIAYHSSGELRSYITPKISYEISKNKRVILSEECQKNLIHGYYASTSFIDAQIGKIVNKLKETGLDQNTIIVIWGSTMFNTAGQKILESNALELDVTDLPTGVYLLNLQNTQNQISTFKIIKK